MFPTLLVLCFVVGLLGVVLARTDGSALYVAFCLLSPVLLPIWIGMQVGELLANMGKNTPVTETPRMVTRMAKRIAFARPRAMAAHSSYAASVAQH